MEVIGVMERKGQTTQGWDLDDMILVPITTARNRLLGGSQAKYYFVNYISVKISDGVDRTEARAAIRALLRERHRLAHGQADDFVIRDIADAFKAREESADVMALLLGAIASVSLLVGGVGIMNMMLVSVKERTREIGLRMAVGARRVDILVQFLAEALTLALAGGLLGAFLGLTASWSIAYFAGWKAVLQLKAVLMAVGFASATGLFFGLYPAHKASGLAPVAALRYE